MLFKSVIKKITNMNTEGKVIFIVFLFVLIAVVMANMLYLQGKVLDGVRAYVRGEAMWAKAQKDAVFYLERYTYTYEESDYKAFEQAIRTNFGDQKARNALYEEPPNREKATQGFLEGENHPEDIDSMIWFFLYFQKISYMHDAIEIWKRADIKIGQIRRFATTIHEQIRDGNKDPKTLQTYREQLRVLNDTLRKDENDFSLILGEGARWVRQTIWLANLTLLFIFVYIAVYISRQIIRGISRAERELMISESRFRSLFESNTIGIVSWKMDGKFYDANDYFLRMLGYRPDEPESETLNWQEMTPEEMKKRDEQAVHELLADGRCEPYEKALIDRYGERVPVYLGASLISGDSERGIAYFMDLRERKKADAQLRLASTVFGASYDGILITDATTTIIAVNQALCRMLGYEEEELKAKTPKILDSEMTTTEQHEEIWRRLEERGHYEGDIVNKTKNGVMLPMRISISGVKDEYGEVTHYVAIFSDITERKAKEEHLEHIAYYDALTGLPNRALLNDRLAQMLKRAERNQSRFAILFLDLDKFKPVNDRFGHAVGDKLLHCVAERLLEHVRGTDTVARLGGDEFIILLEDMNDQESIDQMVDKIVRTVSVPCIIEGNDIDVSVSIGISIYPDDGRDAHTLLHQADCVMYDMKQKNKTNG